MSITLEDLKAIGSRCAGVRTLMTARTVARLFDQQMKQVGLTGTQFTLLVAIGSRQFGSISELGQTLCIEKSTLSRNLRPLIEDGLIERDTKSTGRAIVHRLTSEGEARLKAAYPIWQGVQDGLEDKLGVDEVRDGYRFMAKLRHAAMA
ncbi:MAG: MarR family transcriptional regulator [Ponticaulis sp.]|nr:MarR family transcriptional regulator [Ponticaulis sp.]|tara:strand:+ start:64487 stop:64933 length:447 start_codon:yes stop_codon:yes gene_type:complete